MNKKNSFFLQLECSCCWCSCCWCSQCRVFVCLPVLLSMPKSRRSEAVDISNIFINRMQYEKKFPKDVMLFTFNENTGNLTHQKLTIQGEKEFKKEKGREGGNLLISLNQKRYMCVKKGKIQTRENGDHRRYRGRKERESQ